MKRKHETTENEATEESINDRKTEGTLKQVTKLEDVENINQDQDVTLRSIRL